MSHETKNTWNSREIARLYHEKFMDLPIYNHSYDIICNSITKPNAHILEIGCGPGNISKYLLSKRPDFKILGIDYAPNMIELAAQNNPSAEFAIMDCRDIHQLENKFDAIVCGFCIPYLTDEEVGKFIRDAKNLLLENGLLYISFVEGDPATSGYQVGSTGDRMFFHFHDLNRLQKLLVACGFEDPLVFKVKFERSENQSEVHTILIGHLFPISI